MIFGTVFGVIIIPGLYYIFASMGGNRQLIKDQNVEPLSEEFVHYTEKQNEMSEEPKKTQSLLKKLLGRKKED